MFSDFFGHRALDPELAMYRNFFTTIFLLLLAICAPQSRASTVDVELREDLLRMAAADQHAREQPPSNPEAYLAAEQSLLLLNEKHAKRLKVIVKRHGWPTRSLVGEDGAHAAWLIAQHSDHDPAFQRRVLKLLQALVDIGEVTAADYAYLWDRTHQPQRFGTQGACISPGVWKPRAIEAEDGLDARRAAAGIFLPAMTDYIKMISAHCR